MKKFFVLAIIAFAVIGVSAVSAQEYITMPTDGDIIIQTVAVGGGTLKHNGVLNITKPYGKGSKLILGTTSVSGVVEKNMIFRLEQTSDGWYKLKNKSYGYVRAASPTNNVPVEIIDKDNSDNVRFRFEDAGGGNFYITVFKNPKFYLHTKDTKTDDNTLIVTHTAKGGNNTKWRIFYGRDGGLTNRVFGAYDLLSISNGIAAAKRNQKEMDADKVLSSLATISDIGGYVTALKQFNSVVDSLPGALGKAVQTANTARNLYIVAEKAQQFKNEKNSVKKNELIADMAERSYSIIQPFLEGAGGPAGYLASQTISVGLTVLRNGLKAIKEYYKRYDMLDFQIAFDNSGYCHWSWPSKYDDTLLELSQKGATFEQIAKVYDALVALDNCKR